MTDPSGLVGRVLAGRYEVTGLLGVGGIGRVYRARHVGLRRPVALKVLLEHYACVPDLQRRFEREAMALAALSHPNIVTITDFISTKDVTFLVMELVEGIPLEDLLDEGGVDPATAFAIMEQLLSSLAYAHEHEVVHRDLKPSNILVRELAAGRLHAEILDFGLAKFMDGSGPSANLTKAGLIVGTPAYMAPEQASGAHVGKHADVYAAGILFYEMLCNLHPFEGHEGQDLLRQHLLTPAPTLSEMAPTAEVHPKLEAFLARALAKDEATRFANGGAMLEALIELPEDAYVASGDASPRERVRPDDPTVVAPGRKRSVRPPPASAEPAPLPRRRGVLFGAAALLLFALLAAVGYALFGGDEADDAGATETPDVSAETSTETSTEASAETSTEASAETSPEAETPSSQTPPETPAAPEEAPEAETPNADRPAARNPWRGRVPPELARVRRLLQRERDVPRPRLRTLQRYRTSHPDDARPWLLLAQVSISRGAFTNAVARYRNAYQRDPSVRGDRVMRRQLVELASHTASHASATEALVEIYGSEARSTVERAIAREHNPQKKQRLRATLARLR